MKKFYAILTTPRRLGKLLGATMLMAAFALNSNAQERKSWDFTQGISEETQEAIINDTSKWTASRSNDAYTNFASKVTKSTYVTITAGGVDIPELQGLQFNSGNDNFLLMYPVGTGKIRIQKNCTIKFPKLIAGQKITIVAHSANATATNRGFIGSTQLLDYISGPEKQICLGKDANGGQVEPYTLVYQVKESVTDSTEITIQVKESGLDIYSFMIDEGDVPGLEKVREVLAVTNSVNSENLDEAIDGLKQANGRFNVRTVEATEEFPLDSILSYDAVVVTPWVGGDDAMVSTLRQAVSFVPMLNLNASVYGTWGLGTVTDAGATALNVGTVESIFENLSVEEGKAQILSEGSLSTVALGEYFAADDVIATVGADSLPAMHQHNADRNSYVGFPLTQDAAAAINANAYMQLVANTTGYVAQSKRKIENAGKVTITPAYTDKVTGITMKTGTAGATIHYTLDGEDPTVESAVYTEAFELTDTLVVKAIAVADGYLVSPVSTYKTIIKEKIADPVIDLQKDETSTTVTLSCPTEKVTLYYSFSGITSKDDAQRYDSEKPIVLTQEPGTINVFAERDGYVNSENVTRYIPIKSINSYTIRIDTLSHFSADQNYWYADSVMTETTKGTGSASAYYYWTPDTKKSWDYYSTEIIGYKDKEVTDEDGNVTIEQIPVYKPAGDVRYVTSKVETDWRIYSSGQIFVSQNISPANGIGVDNKTYRAESALDYIGGLPSRHDIQFGAVNNTGDPYSAGVESTVAFKAPFDVVTYLGSGQANSSAVMLLEISADGENWETADTLAVTKDQRGIKKNRVSVEKDGSYYVRIAHVAGSVKTMIFDIYVLNNGEYSKLYDGDQTGIDSVIAQEAAEAVATEIYTVNGVRVNKPVQGLNIIRTIFSDGTSKVRKVVVR